MRWHLTGISCLAKTSEQVHAKLDELLRVDQQARLELTQLDEQEPEVIQHHRNRELETDKH